MLSVAFVHGLCTAACANAATVLLPAMHAVHLSSDTQKGVSKTMQPVLVNCCNSGAMLNLWFMQVCK